MYQVDLCFFRELEEREWGEFETLTWCMGYEEACERARNYANMTLSLTTALELRGYDGCSVDVRRMPDPEPHPYIMSYEFMPGRALQVWRSEECHEIRELDMEEKNLSETFLDQYELKDECHCPVCGTDDIDYLYTDWDSVGYVDLRYRCRKCGSVFYMTYELTGAFVQNDGRFAMGERR